MISFANPSAQFHSYKNKIELAVLKVLRGNQYILGKEVSSLEKEFADYLNIKSVIGVANGTDAIEIALRALNIGQGDEVITVSHTAVATVAAIEATGAKPVLIDVDKNFFTLDVSKLNKAINPNTKAIIAVHLYGQSVDLDKISAFCKLNKVFLIEDVSQAHGGLWNEKKLGTFGIISCFSCYPTKNLGALGDAGLIATNNILLSKKIHKLREYGWKNRYISEIKGRNSRLDEIQAAILRIKLKYLDKDNLKRKKIASIYIEGIKNSHIILPSVREKADPVFHLFVIRTKFRDQLKKHLEKNGISTGIHYPVPIHLQKAYKNKIKIPADLKVTELLAKEVLSLPIFPELKISDVKKVISVINIFNPKL